MVRVYSQDTVTIVEGITAYQGMKLKIHVFLIDGMLIDTGPASLQQELIPFYEQQSFDFVSLTHIHEDHTGCAAWIQRNKQVPLYIHALSLEECRKVKEYHPFRQEFWGIRESFTAEPLPRVIHSRNEKWEAIHTPGHSVDHHVLFNRSNGILFSGDLLLSVKPKGLMKEESVSAIIHSLNEVLRLDVQHLFCSHLGYVENGKNVLKKKKEWLEYIQNETKHLYKQGHSIKEINQKLFPVEPLLTSVSDHQWSSVYMIESVLNEL